MMVTTDKLLTIPEVEGMTFDEDAHIYRVDGLEIPSVSAIMEPLSKAKYRGISAKTLERAAEKGTSVHNGIENFIKFGIEDVPEEHQGYFNAFLDWWKQYNPIVVASEVRVYNAALGYAGTADLIAFIEDELAVVDFKSTYTVSEMTCGVQLEAYARALQSMGVAVEAKRILHLQKEGRFKYIPFKKNDLERWRVFTALKTVHDYIKAA